MVKALVAVLRVAELWVALGLIAFGYLAFLKLTGESGHDIKLELKGMASTAVWIMKRASVGVGVASWAIDHWRNAE
jgi:hypothetical protein